VTIRNTGNAHLTVQNILNTGGSLKAYLDMGKKSPVPLPFKLTAGNSATIYIFYSGPFPNPIDDSAMPVYESIEDGRIKIISDALQGNSEVSFYIKYDPPF
jgi:hypothetical protein